MGMDDAEPAPIAQEVLDLELLPGYHEHVGIELGTVNRGEARIVERLDVDAVNLRADLRPEAAHFDAPDGSAPHTDQQTSFATSPTCVWPMAK
jgi:hypothetical protein